MEFAIFIVFFVYAAAEFGAWVTGNSGGHTQTANTHGLSKETYQDIAGCGPDALEKPITELGINEIKNSGRFTARERAAEYRRRGKSPSGVIDGVYNDMYRGNGDYNDDYRDWEADA